LPNRYPAASDGLWLGVALLVLGAAAVGLWKTPQRINHDCALYLQQAEMLLDGAVPYCDFADTNPPLIMYLNVLPVALARTLGLPVIVTFQAFVLALLALSAPEIYFLLARPRVGLGPSRRGWVLLAWMALYFLIDLHGDTNASNCSCCSMCHTCYCESCGAEADRSLAGSPRYWAFKQESASRSSHISWRLPSAWKSPCG
jgi:hypothetical protein